MGNKICMAVCRQRVEERLTRPQRILRTPPSDVDYTKLRKLILSRKLAPCFDAIDDPNSVIDRDLVECPNLCFYYPSLNRTQCCAKGICTDEALTFR